MSEFRAQVILPFIIFLLTLVLLPQRTTENSKSECLLSGSAPGNSSCNSTYHPHSTRDGNTILRTWNVCETDDFVLSVAFIAVLQTGWVQFAPSH